MRWLYTTTTCIVCGKEFIYHGYKNKCCSPECLTQYKKQLTTIQHSLSYDKVIGRIERYIIENYSLYGIVKTLSECLIELHIAPKTYYKYAKANNISYDKLLSKNNISKRHSKFQSSVTRFVKEIFDKYQVEEEMTFDDCRNPMTNCLLKFDIYVDELNIAIECDGKQHIDKDAYFNKLTIDAGYTPSYITDQIKNRYCKENNIKLIRIPYVRVVTRDYVESFLCVN